MGRIWRILAKSIKSLLEFQIVYSNKKNYTSHNNQFLILCSDANHACNERPRGLITTNIVVNIWEKEYMSRSDIKTYPSNINHDL